MKKSQVSSKKTSTTKPKQDQITIPITVEPCTFGDFEQNPTYRDGTPVKGSNALKKKVMLVVNINFVGLCKIYYNFTSFIFFMHEILI